ncbi:MAG: hypothetical protein WEK74_05610 [Hydrogenophaga sp.]
MSRSPSWLLLCALHGVASMLLWWAGDDRVQTMIWRADGWTSQPWSLWTSAWVHLNTPQLIVNQIALGTLAGFAWVVRPTLACTLAWFLAWPLAQMSLLWWPHIGYAVGLSASLHAGAMVLALLLMLRRIAVPKSRRWGGFLALGLVAKLWVEQGWSQPVVWDSFNNISVVRAAHFTGAVWGLLLASVVGWTSVRRARDKGFARHRSDAPNRESVHP